MDADRWIPRIIQGDEQALEELVEAFYPEILRYCLWHAPNRALAEDAAQETFLKAIRYLDKYAHRGKFKSFLYQIAANTCIDMGRKNISPTPPLRSFPRSCRTPQTNWRPFNRIFFSASWWGGSRNRPKSWCFCGTVKS